MESALGDIELSVVDLGSLLDIPEFTEEEATTYLKDFEPILGSTTINKHSVKSREINHILNDRLLREMLPSGLPEQYYSQEFHKRQMRRILLELRRLTAQVTHPNAYGNGSGRSNLEAFQRVHNSILNGQTHIFRGDFKKCYDSVDLNKLDKVISPYLVSRPALHELILRLQVLPRYWAVFDQWDMEMKGILQGLSPSTHLLDLYLHDFDEFCSRLNAGYIRLHDDFVLPFSDAEAASRAENELKAYLAEKYPTLELHPDKTALVTPGRLQFAGYGIVPGTNLITLSEPAILQLRIKYDDLCDELVSGMEILEFKTDVNQMLRSSQRQLSIVQDEVLIASLWNGIVRRLCAAFRTRYATHMEKRHAFQKLGIKHGRSHGLLKGLIEIEPQPPFHSVKVGEVLFQGWNDYNQ